MRRGTSVTMCRSANALSTGTPTCSTGDGLSVGAWMQGWIIFVDNNGNRTVDAGDTVLKVQEPLTGLSSFFAVGKTTVSAVATGNYITYNAIGRAVGQEQRWLARPAGSLADTSTYVRTLCLNSVGRVRLIRGESTC